MNDDDGKQEYDVYHFDAVLQFYGVELQSHASMILASFIGVFAVLQVWVSLNPKPLSFLDAAFFSLVLGALAFVAFFSFMRLVAYGKLTMSIMMGRRMEFQTAKVGFTEYLPIAQVGRFADWWWQEHFKPKWWARLYTKNKQPNPYLLVGVSAVAVGLSYFLVSIG